MAALFSGNRILDHIIALIIADPQEKLEPTTQHKLIEIGTDPLKAFLLKYEVAQFLRSDYTS